MVSTIIGFEVVLRWRLRTESYLHAEFTRKLRGHHISAAQAQIGVNRHVEWYDWR